MNTIKSILKKPQTTEQLVQATTKTMKRITFNQNVRVRILKSKKDISNIEDSVENINDFAEKDNANDKNLNKKNTKPNEEKLQSTKILVTKSKAINIAPKEEDSVKAVVKALVLEAEVAQPDEVMETLVEALKAVQDSIEACAEADAAITKEEKAKHDAKKAEKELNEASNRGLVTIELRGNTIDKILAAKQAYKRSWEAVREADKKEQESLEALSKAFEVLAKAFEAGRADLISLFMPIEKADAKEKPEELFKALVKASKAKNVDIRSFYTPVVEAVVEAKKVNIFEALEQALEQTLEKDLKYLSISAVKVPTKKEKVPTKEEKVQILNVIAKSIKDYAEKDNYSEEDHSLMFSYEPKLSGNCSNLGYDDTIAN